MRQDCIYNRERWWQSSLSLLPPLGLAVLPKCPFCLVALASSIGLGYLVQTSWLVPLTALCFVAAFGSLAFRARRQHSYAPLCLGLAALALLFAGKYRFNYAPLTYVGLALLILASLLKGKSKARASSNNGCECENT